MFDAHIVEVKFERKIHLSFEQGYLNFDIP